MARGLRIDRPYTYREYPPQPAMLLTPRARRLARSALAAVAIVCVAMTGVSLFLTLQAGTVQMDGDYPDGPAYLLMSTISPVRFRGMIPRQPAGSMTWGVDGKDYAVTLHWFLNAFGWEWPTATWEKSTGIIHNIGSFMPAPSLTLPGDLVRVASRMGLSEADYGCLSTYSRRGVRYYGGGSTCTNEFLAAWDMSRPATASFGTALPLFAYYAAFTMLLVLVVQEFAMRWCHSLTRCLCPRFISKRGWCSCLKKGERMTPIVRLRMRIWGLTGLAIVYALAAATLIRTSALLVTYLTSVDRRVGGMDPQIGTGFLRMSVFTLFAIILSIACLRWRAKIPEPKSWMEEQGLYIHDFEEFGS